MVNFPSSRLCRELNAIDTELQKLGYRLYWWRTSPIKGRYHIVFRAAIVPASVSRSARFYSQTDILYATHTFFTGTNQFNWSDRPYCSSQGSRFIAAIRNNMPEVSYEAHS